MDRSRRGGGKRGEEERAKTVVKQQSIMTDPDRQRSVFAANGAAAVGTAGFWRSAIFLLLLEDLRVEFLPRSERFAHTAIWGDVCCGVPKCQVHRRDGSVSHHHCDSFTVTHKVHVGLPAISLHNLCSRTRVVHGMSWHQVLTVRRPGQAQDMSCPATLRHKTEKLFRLWMEQLVREVRVINP